MQTWSLSKLLLIISLLNIITSVECQGHSADCGRSEACCGWAPSFLALNQTKLQSMCFWIPPSRLGSLSQGCWECQLLTVTVQSLSRTALCQRGLPHAMTGWLEEDRGYRDSAPFAQFGTTRRTNLALELAVGLAEVSVAPASIQIIPQLKPASLTAIQELFYSTLPN